MAASGVDVEKVRHADEEADEADDEDVGVSACLISGRDEVDAIMVVLVRSGMTGRRRGERESLDVLERRGS